MERASVLVLVQIAAHAVNDAPGIPPMSGDEFVCALLHALLVFRSSTQEAEHLLSPAPTVAAAGHVRKCWLRHGKPRTMKQSRLMSLVEALINVAVGFGLAVLTQIMIFPLFGLGVSLVQNLQIGAIFTAVSILRSYTLRRLFEWIRVGRA